MKTCAVLIAGSLAAAGLLWLGVMRAGAQSIAYTPPGRLVNIGGRALHLHCTGSGSPTVVLEAGASAYAIDWALVQPVVARTQRVCSYDRAGYGWSDSGPANDTVEQVTSDLHTLLNTAAEKPPYVMVGASLGGIFVRSYQNRYPSEVIGMVLDDAVHEDGTIGMVDGKPKRMALMTQL